MLDTADEEVMRWAREVLPDAEPRLTAPAQQGDGSRVHLYLTEMRPAPPVRQDRRPPLRVGLSYLVAVISEDTAEAHNWLGRLLFAAMADRRFEVDLKSLTMEAWRAFGLMPQPAFLLRFPFSLDRPQQERLVTEPPTVRPVSAMSFNGVLVGPRDLPIAGACITLTELGINTVTDSRGRFGFAVVPPGSKPRRLRVQARGRDAATLSVPPTDGTNGPAIIRLDKLED